MNRLKVTRRKAITHTAILAGTALASRVSSAAPTTSPAGAATTGGPFVFCLNTGTIRGQKLGLVKEIEIAAQAGYQAIEPWVEAIDNYAKEGGSLKELNQRIADLGLTVESAIAFPEWIVDDEARRAKGMERAKYDMDLVARIGGKRLAAPPVGVTDKPGLDLMKGAERYRALLDAGDQIGVVPQLELWGFSKNLHRLGECAYVAIETGHPKACVLADVFHVYKGGSDFNGLRLLGASLIQVFHMNDYPADPPRDRINDSFRVFPGDGIAPLTQILRHLQAIGGRKVLSLELFNRKYWEQDALEIAKTGLEKMKAATRAALG
jgi:sugar phosphate isomerase/epimerase